MEISIVPRFLIRKISDNDIQQINWNILISTVLILVFLSVLKIQTIDWIPHFCLFKSIIGIPCPACGITRSVNSLKEFNLMESIQFNPNGILLVVIFIIQIPLRIIGLSREDYFPIIQKLSKIMTILLISSLLVYWIIQIINI